MAEKITRNNFHELLEEIEKTEGLPENLSTEVHLWDEILKKEIFVMPEQVFPLIEEIHGKHYEPSTPIKPLATEFSVERSDEGTISSIRGDITLLVDNKDIYHFEGEIENDGTMVLRMFEYDVHIALSYPSKIPSDVPEKSKIALTFPYSAVLYLQDNKNTPDYLECQIQFQDGGTHTYRVPVLKVQSYSLEAIEKKHLSILAPFLPLRFRRSMVKDKATGRISFKLSKEELTSFYQELILILDREVVDGRLSENNRSILLSLLRKSMIRVFHQDDHLIKEVVKMTEPILKLEIEEYIDRYENAKAQVQQVVRELAQANQQLESQQDQIENQQNQIENQQNQIKNQQNQIENQQRQLEDLQKQLEALQRQQTTT